MLLELKAAICITQMGLCYVHLFFCDVHVAVTFERCLELLLAMTGYCLN